MLKISFVKYKSKNVVFHPLYNYLYLRKYKVLLKTGQHEILLSNTILNALSHHRSRK